MAVRLGHDPLRHSVTCSSNDGYNDHFFGIAFFNSLTIGLAATTSPTDAACIQIAL